MNKLTNIYLEQLYLQEDIPSNILSLSKDDSKTMNIFKKIENVVDEKNPQETFKKIKQLPYPTIKQSTVEKISSKIVDDFPKYKDKAKKILTNSLSEKTNEKMIEGAAVVVCGLAKIGKKKDETYDKSFKRILTNLVDKTNNLANLYEDENSTSNKKGLIPVETIPDYALGISLIVLATGTSVVASLVLYTFFTSIFFKLIIILFAVGIIAIAAGKILGYKV